MDIPPCIMNEYWLFTPWIPVAIQGYSCTVPISKGRVVSGGRGVRAGTARRHRRSFRRAGLDRYQHAVRDTGFSPMTSRLPVSHTYSIFQSRFQLYISNKAMTSPLPVSSIFHTSEMACREGCVCITDTACGILTQTYSTYTVFVW